MSRSTVGCSGTVYQSSNHASETHRAMASDGRKYSPYGSWFDLHDVADIDFTSTLGGKLEPYVDRFANSESAAGLAASLFLFKTPFSERNSKDFDSYGGTWTNAVDAAEKKMKPRRAIDSCCRKTDFFGERAEFRERLYLVSPVFSLESANNCHRECVQSLLAATSGPLTWVDSNARLFIVGAAN